jgi:DNA-binding LacI/PurR family transcriptional regulator
MNPRPTQAEIARRVGVTQATVSLVLGAKEPSSRVGPELRDKIQRCARGLGYRPHAGARLMRGKSADIVGILVRNLASPFNSTLAQALEQCLAAHGYTVFIGQTHRDPARLVRYAEDFAHRGADGLVCLDQIVWEQPNLVKKLHATLPSAVFFGTGRARGLCVVDIDRTAAARMATAHLLGRGCRRIGLATWAAQEGFAAGVEARRAGYRQALAAAGLPYEPALVFKCAERATPGAMPAESTIQAVLDGVVVPQQVDAVLGYDDFWAARLVRALCRAGRHVPDDVAVAGLGDTFAATLADPALTTVNYQLEEVATRLVALLVEQIEKRVVPATQRVEVVPPVLVRRESA